MVQSSIVVTAPSTRPRTGVAVSRLRDEALARRIADGDERAFIEIHRRYHGPLYRYCRSIVRHEHDAQDVLQTTLMAAYGALRAGRRDAPLRPWLYRIAHNESISLLRRRRPDAELTPAVPDLAGVEERADVRERMARLVADLMTLPDRPRSALVMRELNGLSHEEIALALQTTPAAAKQTVFEARRALAELDAGRAMNCDEVCRMISDGDGRQLRGRRVRSHLRSCRDCAAFAEAISIRRSDLRALAPGLPAGAGAGLLWQVLGGSPGRSTTGAVSAKALSTGALTKILATGLLIAGGVAGYSHLVHATARTSGHVLTPAPLAPTRAGAQSDAPARLIPAVGLPVDGRGTVTTVNGAAGRLSGASRLHLGAAGRLTDARRRPPGARRIDAARAAGGALPSSAARPGHDAGREAAGAAGTPTRGRSTVHAVRRGWAGADQSPGQARRASGSSTQARGSGAPGSRVAAGHPSSARTGGSTARSSTGSSRSSASGGGTGGGSLASSGSAGHGTASTAPGADSSTAGVATAADPAITSVLPATKFHN
jgi:RNA polymerase sigma factor (sigma-70 family)